MGFGERYDPLENGDVRYGMRGPAMPGDPKRYLNATPGVGEYEIGKKAEQNSGPTWTFGTSERKDIKREDWPGPGDTNVPDYTKGDRKEFSKRDKSMD
jgi:hypothetical protein